MKKKMWAWFLAGTLCLANVAPVYAEEVDDSSSTSSAIELSEDPEGDVADEGENSQIDEAEGNSADDSIVTESNIEENAEGQDLELAASSDFSYYTSGNNAIISSYLGSDADVTIPSTIDGHPVTGIGSYAFQDCTSLTSVKLPDGITSIDFYAFFGCTNLSSINLPDDLTSLGFCAFYNCSSLTSIKIPDGITALLSGPFCGCSSLTSVELPKGLTRMGPYAFKYCSSLTSIEIPDGVSDIGYSAFEGCSSLTSVKLPAGINAIPEAAFKDCTSLTSIELPDRVRNIGDSAFKNCSSLASIDISSGLTQISDNAFYGCKSLTTLSLPASVSWIGPDAFTGCDGLTDIYYEGSRKMWAESLYNSMFGKDQFASVTIHYAIPAVSSYNGVDYSAVYDYDYFHANKDVADAFGDDDEATIENFVKWGMTTGRQGNEEFNVYTYMANYPELKSVYGDNLAGYYMHYIWWGKDAGLVANERLPHDPVTTQNGTDYSAVYDYEYFHANSDVAEAFGDDDVATLANFVQWGMTTGRQGNEEFNVNIYMANYPELKKTYGSNLASYYYHYIWWGKAAGLVANKRLPHDPVTEQDGTDYSAVYDYDYFHANKDVADAFGDDDVATLANFVRWGMTTGRQGSEEFNVYTYMKNYPELKKVYGDNLAGYYYHYIWWGKAAGLIADKEIS